MESEVVWWYFSDMQRTDQALIASHLKGDQNAFGVLAARYVKLVYSVVFHYAKTVQDAEDLTQDVFVKVLGAMRSFDGEKTLKPWILRIARNHALDWVKRKKPLFFEDFASEDEESSRCVFIQRGFCALRKTCAAPDGT